ncbi:MAG: hypothetical protein KGL95_03830, partial [Patescibacteria group bacterium]|nr:hypothetical protein [Patescibacteria group bacterium]
MNLGEPTQPSPSVIAEAKQFSRVLVHQSEHDFSHTRIRIDKSRRVAADLNGSPFKASRTEEIRDVARRYSETTTKINLAEYTP